METIAESERAKDKHIKIAGALMSALLLSACANSSGVLKTGTDSFTISTSASPGRGGIPAAKKIAYQEANEECSRHGLEIFTVSEKAASPTWTEGMATMELNFRCLSSNDPAVKSSQP